MTTRSEIMEPMYDINYDTSRTVQFLKFILLHEKFLQFDWLRAVVFQLNLN